jgi:hypothetical protein
MRDALQTASSVSKRKQTGKGNDQVQRVGAGTYGTDNHFRMIGFTWKSEVRELILNLLQTGRLRRVHFAGGFGAPEKRLQLVTTIGEDCL